MKAIIIGADGLAGSAYMRVWPGLGVDCVPVTRANYQELAGTAADVLVNANGNSRKFLAERDVAGEIDRSVGSVARACVDFKFDRYVQLSSADVYERADGAAHTHEDAPADPARLSRYGLCKRLAESVVRNLCPDWLILRQGGLIGKGLKKSPVYDLLTGGPLFVHPDCRFGYIDTEEVARLAFALLQAPLRNQVFNVCGSGTVSPRELAPLTGRTDVPYPPDAKPFLYEIDNTKLSALLPVPDSAGAARSFIAWWRANNNGAAT